MRALESGKNTTTPSVTMSCTSTFTFGSASSASRRLHKCSSTSSGRLMVGGLWDGESLGLSSDVVVVVAVVAAVVVVVVAVVDFFEGACLMKGSEVRRRLRARKLPCC